MAAYLAEASLSDQSTSDPLYQPSHINPQTAFPGPNFDSIIIETPGKSPKDETFSLRTTVFLTALSLLLRRLPPLRHRIELLPGKSFQLKTSENFEGALAALVGSPQIPTCNRCRTDDGPWTGCYTVTDDNDGSLLEGGACAGCHYDGVGKGCSFRARFDHGSSQQQLQSSNYSQNQSRRNEQRGGISSSSSLAQPISSGKVQSSSLRQRSSPSLRPRHVTIKTKVTATAPKKKKKATKVQERGRIDYKKELLRVNQSVCPDIPMSEETMQVMNDFINDMFTQIVKEAAAITAREERSTITARAIQTAICLQFTGHIRRTAEHECDVVMTRWLAELRERRLRRTTAEA